jgi:hypothetical protein
LHFNRPRNCWWWCGFDDGLCHLEVIHENRVIFESRVAGGGRSFVPDLGSSFASRLVSCRHSGVPASQTSDNIMFSKYSVWRKTKVRIIPPVLHTAAAPSNARILPSLAKHIFRSPPNSLSEPGFRSFPFWTGYLGALGIFVDDIRCLLDYQRDHLVDHQQDSSRGSRGWVKSSARLAFGKIDFDERH